MQEFVPFKQIPYWDLEETFTITGKQLSDLKMVLETFSKFEKILEPLFIESLDSGKIKIRYEDLQGNELSKEFIDEMLKQFETRS